LFEKSTMHIYALRDPHRSVIEPGMRGKKNVGHRAVNYAVLVSNYASLFRREIPSVVVRSVI